MFKRASLFVLMMNLIACSSGAPLAFKSASQDEGEVVGSSTVLNQKLMYEQNAVTPAELLRNVPGVTR